MSRRRLVKIKLIGELGRRFGRCYEFMASSPKEVISALSNQLEGFKDYLSTAHENGVFFRLVSENPEGMSYEECLMPCDALIIAPVVTGAGGGSSIIGKILLGIALIGLAFIPAIGGLAIGLGAAGQISAGSILFSLGGALVFGGIAELLTPTPKNPKESESRRSFLFDRAAELTTQGFPVPLLYGEFLASSPLIISSSISTEGAPL